MTKQQKMPEDCCDINNPCGLCNLTFADIAIDYLEAHWDDPKALKKDIQELLEDDYPQYAKFLFWRLQKIESRSLKMGTLRTKINDRIFWGNSRPQEGKSL